MMVAMVAEVGQCKECYKNKLNVENIANKIMGYCYSIRIYCIDSGWSNVWRTSSTINKSNTPGQKPYEISQRMIAGFLEFGQGLRSMETFSRCLNMPTPLSSKAYNNMVDNMRDVYVETAMQSMSLVFQELSKDELLSKCLHGQTQNANEALNKIIWQRCPKSTFVSKKIVDIAAASAILYFNDGCKGLDRVFSSLGIPMGNYTRTLGAKIDHHRISNMTRKSSEKGKKRRKQLRSIRKGFQDQLTEKEGQVYEPGGY